MSNFSNEAVFGKLNKIAYRGIESATVFCKLRGNAEVELVHWIHQLLQLQDSDLHRIVRRFECDPARIAEGVTQALENLSRGATSVDLSDTVCIAAERGWVYASLRFGEAQVRTGYLVVGILNTRELKNALLRISKEFDKIKLEALTDDFAKIVAGSPEDALAPTDGFKLGGAGAPGEASGAIPAAQLGKQEALKQFTVDLTEQARAGKVDPILGRDNEI